MRITESMDEVFELIYEAKEHICIATRCKDSCPMLASAFSSCASAMLDHADKIYASVKDYAEKQDLEHENLAIWEYYRMKYYDKTSKARAKVSQYSKM